MEDEPHFAAGEGPANGGDADRRCGIEGATRRMAPPLAVPMSWSRQARSTQLKARRSSSTWTRQPTEGTRNFQALSRQTPAEYDEAWTLRQLMETLREHELTRCR